MTDQTGKAEGACEMEDGELFRLVVESATDFAIFTIDPNGRVTSWNPGAERLLGYTGEEILGQSADAIFTPEDQAEAIPDLERRQASSHGKALDERWTMRKDGSRFWASGLLMPLVEPRRGYVRIFRDLTMRHRAEELLREREERFRLLATNIPQLVPHQARWYEDMAQSPMDRFYRRGT